MDGIRSHYYIGLHVQDVYIKLKSGRLNKMEKIEAVKLLHELRTSGYLTNEEFEQKIAEIVGNGTRLINAKQKYLASCRKKES